MQWEMANIPQKVVGGEKKKRESDFNKIQERRWREKGVIKNK